MRDLQGYKIQLTRMYAGS